MEIWVYKCKWILIGALVCKINADFEEKLMNNNIVLDVYYFQNLPHVQVILKEYYTP